MPSVSVTDQSSTTKPSSMWLIVIPLCSAVETSGSFTIQQQFRRQAMKQRGHPVCPRCCLLATAWFHPEPHSIGRRLSFGPGSCAVARSLQEEA